MIKFLKKPLGIIFSIIIILICFFLANHFLKRPKIEDIYDYAVVTKTDIVQEVNATGTVHPVKNINLAFVGSGQIKEIYIAISDPVSIGQVLCQLDNAELQASLLNAQANLESQTAKLAEVQRGTRSEELEITQAEVIKATNTLADAQTNLEKVTSKANADLANVYDDTLNILNSAYYKSSDALHNQVNDLFDNDNTNPSLTFSTSDSQLKINSEQQREEATQKLNQLKTDIDSLINPEYNDYDQALVQSRQYLTFIQSFLNTMINTVNYAIGITETTIATYQTNINIARTNLNTALTNISNQQQTITAQRKTNVNNKASAQTSVNISRDALNLAEKKLILQKAGSTAEQIAIQQAQVKQARAQVQNIQAQLNKTFLYSPIQGIVTAIDIEKGEIISANQTIVSLISQNNLQIETNIPEIDIAKVKINDQAVVTLDAYGPEIIFQAKVIQMDPAETLIEGLTTYKTILQFTDQQKDIDPKPGMTANIDILTAQRENVLTIPQRAITIENNKSFVQIIANDLSHQQVAIEAGLKGSYGNIEIISGLKEGDKVVVFIKN